METDMFFFCVCVLLKKTNLYFDWCNVSTLPKLHPELPVIIIKVIIITHIIYKYPI